MQNQKLLLIRSILLLYRESLLGEKDNLSIDLITKAVSTVKSTDTNTSLHNEKDSVSDLKNIVSDMITDAEKCFYDKDMLLQAAKLACGADEQSYEIIEDEIIKDFDESNTKRIIVSYRKYIANYYCESQIAIVLNKASYQVNVERDGITNINNWLDEVVGNLNELYSNTTVADPAIMRELDMADDSSVSNVLESMKEQEEGCNRYKTGWVAVDNVFGGGIVRGQQILINAIKHNYKTGFSLSLFAGIALKNKPENIDPTKKPLLLRISFEDPLELNLKFLYQFLKYNDGVSVHDQQLPESDEMSAYIRTRLGVNGWHIKMYRIDPTRWSIKELCNKILALEAEGYEIHVCDLDYLGTLPTTHCDRTGPGGSDVRDLFRRWRNFCAGKHITNITPHQASVEAKLLQRSTNVGGVAPANIVKELSGSGYFDKCRTIDNEIDAGVHVHVVGHNDRYYLTVHWEKSKGTVIPEVRKYFLLPFPENGMPIPLDKSDDEPIHITKLPTIDNADDDNGGLF